MLSRHSAAYKTGPKRKNLINKVLLGLIILAILSLLPLFYFEANGNSGVERRNIRNFFETGAFESAYSQSKEILKEKPQDSFLLTIHGFSSYQLAVAQINNSDTISYIDECIWSLRKALLHKENSQDGRIFYVLGKAYYYKGQGYADLAVNYLEKAQALYKAADIPEYLGLAYAAIKDFRSSVAAFTQALTGEPSDVLLLSIARSYQSLGEDESAKAYLLRCLEISRDSKTVATARLLLGNTLAKAGDVSGAEAEYLKVINEIGDNADAHFHLGELYASGGDTTRARAEWRRALRIDPTHRPARNRLN